MSRQPTWDMALALQADMFQRRQGGGRARRAAHLFPRRRRVPRLQVGVGPRRAGGADDAGALRRRLHADPQGAEPCARARRPRSPSTRWSTSATAWRRTSTTCAGAPASWRCWACRCSCSRRAAMRAPSKTFREIARLTKGAYCRFDAGSAAQLRELLSAVAVYAAGGRKALAGAERARRARAAAAAQVGRPGASHAIPAAGPGGAAAVPARRARLHDGQSAGAGAPAAHRRRRRRAGGGGLSRVPRPGRLRHVAGGAGLVAAVGAAARSPGAAFRERAEVAGADLARGDRAPGGRARPRHRRDHAAAC